MNRHSLMVFFTVLLIFTISIANADEARSGYWERVNSIDEKKYFNEELVDKNYWSANFGGFNGNSSFTTTYVGPNEEDDYAPRPKNGESATVTSTISVPPQYFNGGEKLNLNINLEISSSNQHFFDFRGDASARFDEPGVPIGHVTGGAINFTVKDENGDVFDFSVWLYGPTNWRFKEYGNQPKQSVVASAEAPYGREEGEKISIYTQAGMGNLRCRTEYVYVWHVEGKAPKSTDNKGVDSGNKIKDTLKWAIPAGVLIGGGGYGASRIRKRKKNGPNIDQLRDKRNKLRKKAKEGNEYAGKMAEAYDDVIEGIEWNDGVRFGDEHRIRRLSRMYTKFMNGDIGENAAPDELGKLESETSMERFKRNRENWKQTNKDGTEKTFEEVARGDSAKAVIVRAGMDYLTGGASEAMFGGAEAYYTTKDAIIEEGRDGVEAIGKAVTNYGIGKVTDKAIKTTVNKGTGKFLSESTREVNKAVTGFAEKSATGFTTNEAKSLVWDLEKSIRK